MPRGDKSKCTDKEERQAEHIEEGYEKRGTPEDHEAQKGIQMDALFVVLMTSR